MATLNLHVGQWKTGTTFIQTSLRLSRAALAARGLAYPARNEPADPGPAAITVGNGGGLLRGADAFAAELRAHRPPGGMDCLFSSEVMQRELREAPDLAFIPRVAREAGFARVRVLVFVRNPIGHAASAAQQDVKRHGGTGTAEEIFRVFEGPLRAAELLDRLEALDGVETAVRNYSACKDRLLEEFAACLGLPEGTLIRPPVARINRSLTAGELELQRALNAVVGTSHRFLADPLCERLPDVEAPPILPSREVQEEIWTRLLPAMERVNARLPDGHAYRPDFGHPAETAEGYVFSADQLRVIAEGFGAEAARLQADLDRLRRDPASSLGARALAAGLMRRLLVVASGREARRGA